MAVLAEHAVPRAVEAVRVVLEPVAKRDARDGEPAARVVQEARATARVPRARSRGGSWPRRRRATRRRARDPRSAGRRRRARPDASACAGGCDARSARPATRFQPSALIFGPARQAGRIQITRPSARRAAVYLQRVIWRPRRSPVRRRIRRTTLAAIIHSPCRPRTWPPVAAGRDRPHEGQRGASRATGEPHTAQWGVACGAAVIGALPTKRRAAASWPPAAPQSRRSGATAWRESSARRHPAGA